MYWVPTPCCSKLFFFFKCFFIYFWLCWVFISVRGLSLVAASRGHSSSRCAGLSLSRPLPLQSTSSRRAGSVVVAHGPTCSTARGIVPDQGSNPCPLHWQADSQPLRHQGSPQSFLITRGAHTHTCKPPAPPTLPPVPAHQPHAICGHLMTLTDVTNKTEDDWGPWQRWCSWLELYLCSQQRITKELVTWAPAPLVSIPPRHLEAFIHFFPQTVSFHSNVTSTAKSFLTYIK